VAQVVELLSGKHEALSSNTSTMKKIIKKLNMELLNNPGILFPDIYLK
jgi:hypothetical protein